MSAQNPSFPSYQLAAIGGVKIDNALHLPSNRYQHNVLNHKGFEWIRFLLLLSGLESFDSSVGRLMKVWIACILLLSGAFIPIKVMAYFHIELYWSINVIGLLWTAFVSFSILYFAFLSDNWVKNTLDILIETKEDEDEVAKFISSLPIVVISVSFVNLAFMVILSFYNNGRTTAGEIALTFLWPWQDSFIFRIIFMVPFAWLSLCWMLPLPIFLTSIRTMIAKVKDFREDIFEKKPSFKEINHRLLFLSRQVDKLNEIFGPWFTFLVSMHIPLVVFILYRVVIEEKELIFVIILNFWLIGGLLYLGTLVSFSASFYAALRECLDRTALIELESTDDENGRRANLFYGSILLRLAGFKIFHHVIITWDLIFQLSGIISSLFFLVANIKSG